MYGVESAPWGVHLFTRLGFLPLTAERTKQHQDLFGGVGYNMSISRITGASHGIGEVLSLSNWRRNWRKTARKRVHWIMRAPGDNPGLLGMFAARDDLFSAPNLVPWAGEFIGKYLLSGDSYKRSVILIMPFGASQMAKSLLKLYPTRQTMGTLGRFRRMYG